MLRNAIHEHDYSPWISCFVNGHATGTDSLEVPTIYIYKAYVSGLCKGLSPQNSAENPTDFGTFLGASTFWDHRVVASTPPAHGQDEDDVKKKGSFQALMLRHPEVPAGIAIVPLCIHIYIYICTYKYIYIYMYLYHLHVWSINIIKIEG